MLTCTVRSRPNASPKRNDSTPGALPAPQGVIPPTTSFRSTWIVASQQGLRARGFFDRYERRLVNHRDAILSAIAGVWLPIDVVRSHYEACEELSIPDPEYVLMVKAGSQVRQAWFSRLIAEAQHPEATPWTALHLMHRGWARAAEGGAVGISRLGDNCGRLEYVGCSLFEIPYFRRAVQFMIQFLVARTAAEAAVRDLAGRKAHACSYLVEWPSSGRSSHPR